MTDDLVERLRDERVTATRTEAADRIEECEKALANMQLEYDKRGERIEELEAKLAKAVEALAWCSIYEESEVATTTLAELEHAND